MHCRLLFWNKPDEYIMGKVPTGEDLMKDYTQVWEGQVRVADDHHTCIEHLFCQSNAGELFSQAQLIGRNGSHTSMSVGDVAVVDGVGYLCDSKGWMYLGPLTERYLIHVWRDVEPEVMGPFKNDDERLEAVEKVMRCSQMDSVFVLNVCGGKAEVLRPQEVR